MTSKNLQPDGLNAEPQKDFHQARAEAKESDKAGFRVRFLSNTYDPKDHQARMYIPRRLDESPEEAWHHHEEWLVGKIIGDPCGTEYYTVEQLQKMRTVGVYLKCLPEEPRGTALDALFDEDSPLNEAMTK